MDDLTVQHREGLMSRRTLLLTSAAAVLAACSGGDSDRAANTSAAPANTSPVSTQDTQPASTNALPTVHTPESVSVQEREVVIDKVDKFVVATTALVLAQRNNPNSNFKQSDTYDDGQTAPRNLVISRTIVNSDGTKTLYKVNIEGRSVDTNPGETEPVRAITFTKVDLTPDGDIPSSYPLELEIIPVDEEGFRLAGKTNGQLEEPFAFHSTEQIGAGEDQALKDMFKPLTLDWAGERLGAAQGILDTITIAG